MIGSIKKYLIVFITPLLLSSCTVAHYQIRNKLTNTSQEQKNPCDIKFSLDITSGGHTNTFGTRESTKSELHELNSKYIKSTKKIFNAKGCTVTEVKIEREANFHVRVERLIDKSALPQEWLTGLSVGLIPSWGTRPSQYIYTFDDTHTVKKHSFDIDQKSYNHIILFPIFWVTFIMLDEFNVYEKALTNFIERS